MYTESLHMSKRMNRLASNRNLVTASAAYEKFRTYPLTFSHLDPPRTLAPIDPGMNGRVLGGRMRGSGVDADGQSAAERNQIGNAAPKKWPVKAYGTVYFVMNASRNLFCARTVIFDACARWRACVATGGTPSRMLHAAGPHIAAVWPASPSEGASRISEIITACLQLRRGAAGFAADLQVRLRRHLAHAVHKCAMWSLHAAAYLAGSEMSCLTQHDCCAEPRACPAWSPRL